MKKIIILSMAAIAALASCNKNNNDMQVNAQGDEMSFMLANNGTRGYVDGTTFYEKVTDSLHHADVKYKARDMYLSAFYYLQGASAGESYFIGEKFSKNGKVSVSGTPTDVWRHDPAYYWPIASNMNFLAYSSTVPFAAKDALWDTTDPTASVILKMDKSRCQDDVLYASAQMASKDATTTSSTPYATAQPVSMEFSHSQAWLEFQLSVRQEDMKDKIAIKEIVVENAYDAGKLTVTRTGAAASAEWNFDSYTTSNIKFADNYGVYGWSKTADDYATLKQNIETAEANLETAKESGNTDAEEAAENALKAAKDALDAAVKSYALYNPLNKVGVKNDRAEAAASKPAEVEDGSCAFLDMLLPQQNKTAFVIKYVLAGRPEVLEYRYDLSAGTGKWLMGHKYIYDIDFVISEITVAPTVLAFEALFDGKDLTPVELI